MKYQVMPDLTPIEYEALKADIAERGVLVPVEVDENGDVLDGHHRIRAWHELRSEGVNLPNYPKMVRAGMTEEQKRNHARSLNVLRRHLSKEQRDEVMRAMRADGATIQKIADTVGVGVGTVHRALSDSDFPNGKSEIVNERGQLRPATYQRQPDPAPLPAWVTRDYATVTDSFDDGEPLDDSTDDDYEPTTPIRIYNEYTEQTETLYLRPDEYLDVAKKPHVANNSGNNEWYTPAEYIESARRVMGHIDLDPASSDIANETVQATTYYTAEIDGLSHHWRGNVWMNPPYAGDLIGKFASKLAYHVAECDVRQAIVLVNNATETAWFQEMIGEASAIVFPRGRVRFWKPDGELGAPLQGQAILYIGQHPDKFLSEFSRFGWGANIYEL